MSFTVREGTELNGERQSSLVLKGEDRNRTRDWFASLHRLAAFLTFHGNRSTEPSYRHNHHSNTAITNSDFLCIGGALLRTELHSKSPAKCLSGFQLLTAMVMKNSDFWDITPCRPLKANRRFGRTYCFHRQGGRINQARNQHEAGSKFC
jgi:hypothetical protein